MNIENTTLIIQNNQYNLKLGGTMYDEKFIKLLQSAPHYEWHQHDKISKCKNEFIETIHNWILSTKLNNIKGLENFKNRYVINGVTHSLDEAHFRYHDKNLKIFRGEYSYTRDYSKKYIYIDDNYTICENDAVIISLPFSKNGKQHEHMHNILEMCTIQKVPVLIDCAWFGTCRDINFDFNYDCIESVSFSLTKGLGLGDQRIGIEYSKLTNNRLAKINECNHLNLNNARIGIYFMNQLSPDFLQNKYYETYKKVCSFLNLEETNCIHIGISNDDKWKACNFYNVNRINVGRLTRDVYNNKVII